jgi:hypothetical protein
MSRLHPRCVISAVMTLYLWRDKKAGGCRDASKTGTRLRRGVDSAVIEETARVDEWYTSIALKQLASSQIRG